MRAAILILVTVVALGFVWAGNDCGLSVGCQGWHQLQTEIDGMYGLGMEDVRIFGVSPKQDRPLLFGGLIDFILTNSYSPDLKWGVRTNDGIGWIDFIPR